MKKCPLKRFEEKFVIDNNGCWVWKASVHSRGYGQFSFNGKPRLAHKWFYEYKNGKVKDGLELDHLCRNKLCVNPDHLEEVTRSENTRRGIIGDITRERSAKITHCPKGHEYTEENTYITKQGTRCCIKCKRESTRLWRLKK